MKTLGKMIFYAVVAGAGSGIIATALTTGYLAQYASQVGEQTAPLRLSQVRPQALPASYEEALMGAHQKAVPAFATVWVNNQTVGAAVALTSDGWFAAVLPGVSRARTGTVRIGQERFAVERVETDSATGVSFLKTDAQNISVASFARDQMLLPGAQVFVVPAADALFSTSIYAAVYEESDVPVSPRALSRWLLPQGLATASMGAPVFNLASELVGLVEQPQGDQAKVLPIERVLPAFDALLKTGSVRKPLETVKE